jgi:hypothetical protein
MVKCCVFFSVRTKFLNIIPTKDERALPGDLRGRKFKFNVPPSLKVVPIANPPPLPHFLFFLSLASASGLMSDSKIRCLSLIRSHLSWCWMITHVSNALRNCSSYSTKGLLNPNYKNFIPRKTVSLAPLYCIWHRKKLHSRTGWWITQRQ